MTVRGTSGWGGGDSCCWGACFLRLTLMCWLMLSVLEHNLRLLDFAVGSGKDAEARRGVGAFSQLMCLQGWSHAFVTCALHAHTYGVFVWLSCAFETSSAPSLNGKLLSATKPSMINSR